MADFTTQSAATTAPNSKFTSPNRPSRPSSRSELVLEPTAEAPSSWDVRTQEAAARFNPRPAPPAAAASAVPAASSASVTGSPATAVASEVHAEASAHVAPAAHVVRPSVYKIRVAGNVRACPCICWRSQCADGRRRHHHLAALHLLREHSLHGNGGDLVELGQRVLQVLELVCVLRLRGSARIPAMMPDHARRGLCATVAGPEHHRVVGQHLRWIGTNARNQRVPTSPSTVRRLPAPMWQWSLSVVNLDRNTAGVGKARMTGAGHPWVRQRCGCRSAARGSLRARNQAAAARRATHPSRPRRCCRRRSSASGRASPCAAWAAANGTR